MNEGSVSAYVLMTLGMSSLNNGREYGIKRIVIALVFPLLVLDSFGTRLVHEQVRVCRCRII